MLFSLFCAVVLLGNVYAHSDEGTETHLPKRYLFAGIRCDGFNNQRISISMAIFTAMQMNRTWVLPWFHEYVQYGRPKGTAQPWDLFFQRESVAKLIPVASAEQFKNDCPDADLYVCGTGDCCQFLIDDLGYKYNVRHEKSVPASRALIESLSQPESESCVVTCPCAGGLLGTGDFFGPYSDFSQMHGWSVSNANYRQVFAHLLPSSTVLAAKQVTMSNFPLRYNAIHVRRGDFSSKCKELGKSCTHPDSAYQSDTALANVLTHFQEPELALFVASEDIAYVHNVIRKARPAIRLLTLNLDKLQPEVQKHHDVVSYMEQLVCADAVHFVGNRFSSWSSTVLNLRLLKNASSSLW